MGRHLQGNQPLSCRKMNFPDRLVSLQSHQVLPHHLSCGLRLRSPLNPPPEHRGWLVTLIALSTVGARSCLARPLGRSLSAQVGNVPDAGRLDGRTNAEGTGIPPSNTGRGLDASPTRQPTHWCKISLLTSRRRSDCPDTNACVRLRRPTEKSTRTPHCENLQTREVPEDRVVCGLSTTLVLCAASFRRPFGFIKAPTRDHCRHEVSLHAPPGHPTFLSSVQEVSSSASRAKLVPAPLSRNATPSKTCKP